MKVAVIGLGLIGGSMALAIRDRGLASVITGTDLPAPAARALELGLVDRIATLEEAIRSSDLVILATPVHILVELLPGILDLVQKQVVMDVGSTKQNLVAAIGAHPRRGRFVASHPMWGTEFSGPDAALHGAFVNKAAVICNREESDKDALLLVEGLYRQLGMHMVYMNATEHDLHVAYVSHISHITSFALANTVLEKEKEEGAIFELASGGFESTVRLAKSNPATWTPIFLQNRTHVLDVLEEHISQLQQFRTAIEQEDAEALQELMRKANAVRRIL